MKLRCTITNMVTEINQFKHTRQCFEYVHPIFTLSKRELLSIYKSHTWINKSDDVRLLTAALFYSTDLVRIDYPIYMNMDIKPLLIALPRLADFIDTLEYAPLNIFSRVSINRDNNNLSNINNYIDLWEEQYNELCSTNRIDRDKSSLHELYQSAIDNIARTAYKRPDKYHKMLARYIVNCISDKSLNTKITVKNANKSGNTDMLLKDYYIYIIEYCGILAPENYLYVIDIPSQYYPESSYINKLLDLIRITFAEKENQHYYRVIELLSNMSGDTKILTNLGKLKYSNLEYMTIGDYELDTKPILDRLREEYMNNNPLPANPSAKDKALYNARLQNYIMTEKNKIKLDKDNTNGN